MIFRVFIGAIVAIILSSIAPASRANDTYKSAWESKESTISFEGTAVKPEMVHAPLNLELITSSHEDSIGKVGFVCMNGTYKAVIATKAVDLAPTMEQIWRRDHVIRGVKPRITINGKSKNDSVWAKSNKLGVALPNSKMVATQLYNAVIRQDEVFLQMSGMKKTKLILPVSDNTFANFGAECGLGLKAVKK